MSLPNAWESGVPEDTELLDAIWVRHGIDLRGFADYVREVDYARDLADAPTMEEAFAALDAAKARRQGKRGEK